MHKMEVMMGIYINLKEKRREKQRKYELSVLRDIHIRDIRQSVRKDLIQKVSIHSYDYEKIEQILIDYIVEIYLYGASFGRWGYYGEDFIQIKSRMKGKEKFITEELYQAICQKIHFQDEKYQRNILYIHTQNFVEIWLKKGFKNGMKKYKLKIVP